MNPMPFGFAWEYLGKEGVAIRRQSWPVGSFVMKVTPQPFYVSLRLRLSTYRPSDPLSDTVRCPPMIQMAPLLVLVNRKEPAKPWAPTMEDMEARDWLEVDV